MVQSKSVTATLRARDSGFTSTFSKANSLLGTFAGNQNSAGRSSKGLLGSVKSVAVGMGLYQGVAKATTLVTSKLGSAFGRIDTMTNFNRTMGILKFSTEETKATLESLKGATKGTAYGLDVATKSAQNFITRGLNPNEATRSVSIWMDAVSTFGKGTNDELASVTDALAKMRTKGTVEMDQLNRLFDVGIDAVGMYAKATGKSSAEVQEALSDKTINTKQFLDVVEKAMYEGTNGVTKLAGAAKEAGATWTGTFDNMGAAVTRGVVSMIEKLDLLSEKVTGRSLKTWVKDFGVSVEEGLGKAADVVEKFANNSIPYINIFKNAVQEMKGPVIEAFQAVVSNVGFMNSGFSRTDGLRTFSSVVGAVSDKVVQFSGFIENNSVVIGKAIDLLPQLLTTFMALKTISTVSQTFATFGTSLTTNVLDKIARLGEANEIVGTSIKNFGTTISEGFKGAFGLVEPIISKFTTNFKFSMSTLSEFDDKGKFFNFTRSIGESLSSLFPTFDSFRTNLRTSKSQLDSLGGSSVGNFFRSFAASLELSNGKLLSFSNFVKHPISGLKSFGAGLIESTGKSNVFAAGISAAGTKVGSGLKAMSMTGVSAIKALGSAMVANPITAVLVGITAAVAFAAASWRTNFMNIQGVVKSFTSGIGNSLTSMKDMFKGMEPAIKPVITVFKGLGAVLTGVVLVGVSAVVDIFRTLVLGITTVIKSVQALSFGMDGLWKKIKGDSDGADESFNKMKKSIDSIGEGFDSWKDNSAIVSTGTALGEFGKTAEDTSKKVTASFDLSAKRVTDFSSQFSTKISEVNTKFSELFAGENSSDRLKEYTANGVKILSDYGEKQVAISEKYNELMTQAEQAKGDEKQAIQAKANELLLSENRTGNASMLALYKEYSDQLKTNKNIEGQELTSEQRQALTEQTNAIREGLAEQNELYVQASLSKLEMQGKLNESEQKAAESNLQALYTNKKEQITSNEDQIQELVAQRNEAKTESEKQAIQAQIDTLAAGNTSLLEQQQLYGEQQLALILNGNELNADAVAQGLATRTDITDEQLALIYQSFVNSSNDIDANMVLLGGILSKRGFEGAQLLGDALRSGDLSALGGELTAEMEAGISGLPSKMFWGGDSGKTMFINALRNGDYAGAGKFITESVDGALKQGTSNAGKEGSNTGKDYSSNVANQKGNAKKSGTDVSTSSTEGMKSQHGKQQEAGKTSGTRFASGVSSQTGTARNAGVSLGSSAADGARSTQGQFVSVGNMLAQGVASGINSGAGAAVAAMASLVNQVNAEANKVAKIKSPSRLMMPTGDFMGQGVGVGIQNSWKFVKGKIHDFVYSINSEFDGGLATSYDMSMFTTSEMKVTHSQDNSFTNSLIEEVRSLKEYVRELQMQVYLDTGVLVGEMDKGLGSQKDKNGRYKL